jgi:hypothetical protein
MDSATRCPKLSIVIPVIERHSDLSRLFTVYRDEVRRTGHRAEFLFIVHRLKQDTLPELRRLQEENSEDISVLLLGGDFGESKALSLGIQKARGELIVTMAPYLQIDPQGFAQAVHLVDSGEADVVVGRRHPGADSDFDRARSRLFHLLVRALTKTKFHDLSCSFRVLRADVARELPFYGGLHRFIPILASNQGFHVREMLLRQHPEDATSRRDGVGTSMKDLFDVLTVSVITRFARRPLRFFGPLGAVLALAGVMLTAYLGLHRLLGHGPIAHRPMLLVAVLLVVVGAQSLSLGLVGEIISFTHARRLSQYRVAEVIRAARSDPSSAIASTSAVDGANTPPLAVVTKFQPRSS